jgi:hypothetical protein
MEDLELGTRLSFIYTLSPYSPLNLVRVSDGETEDQKVIFSRSHKKLELGFKPCLSNPCADPLMPFMGT